MLDRVFELYNQGGVTELIRGIKDFAIFNTRAGPYLIRLYSPKTLEIEGTEIRFSIARPEDIWRSRGHGETNALADFKNQLSDDAVVWDIGANVGSYSIIADRVGAVPEAFEPGGSALRLRANAKLNEVNINVHEFALADTNEKRRLSSPDRSGIRALTNDVNGEVVEVRRGDDVDVRGPEIVKIDVEGAEAEVIRGMQTKLRDVDTCYVEYHSEELKEEVKKQMDAIGMGAEAEFDGDILKFVNDG